ncbi:MAG: hypothetical protein ABDH37_08565, partial [Candidatus Hydrothermales bacterium]
MKRLLILSFLFFFNLKGQEMPCSAPPHVSVIEKPNVLIVLDVTGSMRWRAAKDLDPDGSGPVPVGGYLPSFTYYGYFDPDKLYRWQQNRFVPIGNATSRDINSTNFNP